MAALEEVPHRRHLVRVEEDVGALRRAVSNLAPLCGGVSAGDAALVATELATNLVHHTTSGGYVLYRGLRGGIELLAVDRGPGMVRSEIADPEPTAFGAGRASETRSARGLGAGLAGVKRLASTFDVYSTKPEGTVVLARLGSAAPRNRWCRWGGVNIPARGEEESGDGWAVSANGSLAVLVVDGLGHGPAAADASQAAVSVFADHEPFDLLAFVSAAHEAMRGTRGGALAACVIDPEGEELSFVGLGNISARLIGERSRALVGREGTLGAQVTVPRARVEQHRFEPGATLVMASDGLRSQWDPAAYQGLLRHDPVVVAAVLERDFGRGNDDATVVVIQDVRREMR